MSGQTGRSSANLLGMAALGVAGLFAVFVVAIYLLASGDDDTAAAPGTETPFGGTPFPDLPGMPTAVPDTGPLEPNRPAVGDPAPDFALVDARDATRIRRLTEFAGKPVVINWFASWCDPCRREMPAFQQAHEALGDSVEFLGVNFLESSDKAVSILDETGATFPAVLDPNGAVSDHYRITQGLPVTMFIDADGIVRAIHTGEVEPDELVEELAKVGIDYEPPASG